jgi:hypothetical protein
MVLSGQYEQLIEVGEVNELVEDQGGGSEGQLEATAVAEQEDQGGC